MRLDGRLDGGGFLGAIFGETIEHDAVDAGVVAAARVRFHLDARSFGVRSRWAILDDAPIAPVGFTW